MTFASGDLLSAVIALILAWGGIMKWLFSAHEQRMNEKLKPINDVLHDVKRLELDLIRVDSKIAITYATKEELVRAEDKHSKVIERIFALLQVMNDKLDQKADKAQIRQEPR